MLIFWSSSGNPEMGQSRVHLSALITVIPLVESMMRKVATQINANVKPETQRSLHMSYSTPLVARSRNGQKSLYILRH